MQSARTESFYKSLLSADIQQLAQMGAVCVKIAAGHEIHESSQVIHRTVLVH